MISKGSGSLLRIGAVGVRANRSGRSDKKKDRSLGERPAFLGSPPGCGISKPWGVWEGGFDERPGEPPADYLNSSLTERTLTNGWRRCHLQIRISSSVRCFNFLTNSCSPRYKIGGKGHTDFASNLLVFQFSNRIQVARSLTEGLKTCFECKILSSRPLVTGVRKKAAMSDGRFRGRRAAP